MGSVPVMQSHRRISSCVISSTSQASLDLYIDAPSTFRKNELGDIMSIERPVFSEEVFRSGLAANERYFGPKEVTSSIQSILVKTSPNKLRAQRIHQTIQSKHHHV